MTAPHGMQQTRDLVRTALLIALCAAMGYAFAGLPNVELISAATFVSGAWVGPRRGALVGGLAEAIFAGFNPDGVSPPPLYVAQILGFVLIGGAGGLLGPLLRRAPLAAQIGGAAVAGLVLTLVYDVLTNFAVWVMAREASSLAAVLLGGLSFPFPLAHSGLNTLAFAVVVPAVLRAMHRWSAT